MKQSDDRIPTTRVGSLVRPPELPQLTAAARKRLAEMQKYWDAFREFYSIRR
jgi:methionine synthase II (cobalamin-independent)